MDDCRREQVRQAQTDIDDGQTVEACQVVYVSDNLYTLGNSIIGILSFWLCKNNYIYGMNRG